MQGAGQSTQQIAIDHYKMEERRPSGALGERAEKPLRKAQAEGEEMSFTFHRPKADSSAGFPAAPPRGIDKPAAEPRKRTPAMSKAQQAASALRTDAERLADRHARITAFQPNACNFTIAPASTTNTKTASSRFKTS